MQRSKVKNNDAPKVKNNDAPKVRNNERGDKMTDRTIESDNELQTWRLDADHVQAVLKYIRKRRGPGVTAEELVQWDLQHGRRLFNWNDAEAAHEWRLQQARCFINSFRGVWERTKIRLYRHVPANEETGRTHAAYLDVQTIAEDPKLREWAIADLTKRIAVLGGELAFWKLHRREQAAVVKELITSAGWVEPEPLPAPTRRRPRERQIEAQ
jgi:hypothetical protein